MENMQEFCKFKRTVSSLGVSLLLAGLLGCHTPLVNVEVKVDANSCQQGGTGKEIESPPPPGLCNSMTYTTGVPGFPSAVGFIDDNTGNVIPSGSPLTCSASQKCKALPGTCPTTGRACKSHRAATGSCYCGC
jgi:hypothetical protein